MSLIHREVMELAATPAQISEFIMTPERILDDYPQPVAGGVLEAGHAIWCQGQMGVSMLERIEDACNESLVVIKVTTALGLEAPFTRERIEEDWMFSMIEDWELAASDTGTRLTKTWRDAVANGEPPFPLEETLRQSAAHETGALIEGWNRAAKEAGS